MMTHDVHHYTDSMASLDQLRLVADICHYANQFRKTHPLKMTIDSMDNYNWIQSYQINNAYSYSDIQLQKVPLNMEATMKNKIVKYRGKVNTL